MTARRRYRAKAGRTVVAVQLKLDTAGFTYRKWGHEQHCKPDDWLVNNGGDVYTIDADSFAATYEDVGAGNFRKKKVWAEIARQDGSVATKEGRSDYRAGDFLVSNNEDGSDAYCVGREKFETMYEPDD